MSIWQNPADGSLHDDDNGAALSLPCWPANLTLLTDEQAQALQNPVPTAAQQWAAYQAGAKSALDASDTTMHRVTEAVSLGLTTLTAADVVAFVQWRRQLREIVKASEPASIPTSLPMQPPYPANT